MTELVRYAVDGPVALITLNRPERLNAMNQEIAERTERGRRPRSRRRGGPSRGAHRCGQRVLKRL
ncbi:MAG: hypothetical protein Ct9H300mP16_01800 [Pseudomonadota bacterium]|nr:MAG: hypothetical protein Ct9H300mP16_01800 [Pseudomonadota bacterium]